MELARRLDLPFIELDALYWKENWGRPSDEEFRELLRAAHTGDCWVSAGNYLRQARLVTWPLADTFVWLDVGMMTTTWRILRRSWRRWRSNELLWGTCRENLWRQFELWSEHRSLIRYNWSRQRAHREAFSAGARDAEAAGKRVLRLRSPRQVRELLERLPRASSTGP
ncbi:MAG: adenylate kinase [Tepidiforma sp.]|nr:MAG: adenylate kinase [Tepidiforma sp.]